MAKVAKVVEGRIETTEVETPTFEECQQIIGGFVEIVRLAHGAVALVNEDGIAMGLPTWEMRSYTETGWPRDLTLHGNAVFLNKDEADKVLGGE